MAKQTFTTGQILLAAQMTDLQQTAMGGGSAVAKTASYTLVAADAGTTVIMNSASATTITVNTSLFAPGDTVNIQNVGAGICTVTAGTATVNTAGSLALNQHEGGVLYFRSTSVATFFDYVQTGSVSPNTTKGDLYGFSTLDARVPIGANNTVLTADSAQALGLKWATPATGGETLISTTTLTGATLNLTSIAGTFNSLRLKIVGFQPSIAGTAFGVRPNNDTGTVYKFITGVSADGSFGTATLDVIKGTSYTLDTATQGISILDFPNYADTTAFKIIQINAFSVQASTNNLAFAFGNYAMYSVTAITSLTLFVASGTMAGTAFLYGVK